MSKRTQEEHRHLAAKQIRHASDNIWNSVIYVSSNTPTNNCRRVLNAMANYIQYGNSYNPQLREQVATLLNSLDMEYLERIANV